MYNLIEVDRKSKKHIEILYDVLKEKQFNISHENQPKKEEHLKFVSNHPYRKWYLIKKENDNKGSVYITYGNIIGLNILAPSINDYVGVIGIILKKHEPLEQIKSIRSKYFNINANPNNSILIEAINKLQMVHIQNTYACKL